VQTLSPVLGTWRTALRSLITLFARTPLHAYPRRGMMRLAAAEMVQWNDTYFITVALHKAGGVRAAGILALCSHFDRTDQRNVSG
jgi:hypothetical protein